MRLNGEAMRYAKGPYSWEYIAERPEGTRYRIRDCADNAVGSAATESDASEMVRKLNGSTQ